MDNTKMGGISGILPEWYSPREKKHYGEIGEYKTIRRKKM